MLLRRNDPALKTWLPSQLTRYLHSGEHTRRSLTARGIWLGRLVASLRPHEPEALGLLAPMLHAQARREARRDAQGDFVPLNAQDPARWDTTLIDQAEALLLPASRMGAPGRFQLEAAVQSAHAARRFSGSTDWAAIVELYDALLVLTGSAVVAINRAARPRAWPRSSAKLVCSRRCHDASIGADHG